MARKFFRKNVDIGARINSMLVRTIAVAVVILGVSLSSYEIEESIRIHRASLENTGYALGAAITNDLDKGNKANIDQVFSSITRLPQVVAIKVMNAAGQTVTGAGDAGVLANSKYLDGNSLVSIFRDGLLPVSVGVTKDGRGIGQVILVGDMGDLREQVIKLLISSLFAICLAIPIAMLFGLRLQRRMTAPIKQLTAAMFTTRQNHDFQTARIAGAEGEIKELAESFNAMISEIVRRDHELHEVAFTDQLTGVANRVHFMRRLESMNTPTGLPVGSCLFQIEVQKYNVISSTLGQTTSDELLRSIAQRLAAELQKGAFLARWSESSFAFIATGINGTVAAQDFVAPIAAAFIQPFVVAGQHFHVAVNGGYAVVSNFNEITPNELLRRTNLALAESKRQGPGRIVGYLPQIAAAAQEEAEIERELGQAIARNELQVFYQAVVNLKEGKVSGYEALVRWKRPDGRFVSPARFIPIAEQAGLITALGEWVLRQACKDAKLWTYKNLPRWTISVNVSAAQLLLEGFSKKVRTILNETGLPPEQLCLELTESIFAGNSMSAVRTIVDELRALGVKVALDDFGTGYSSLSYLEHLSFDKLKIDRSFVRSDTASGNRKALIAGIINLARAVGATVVAEGAETRDEVAMLHELGVEEIQGYYFAKPMVNDEAVANALALDGVNNPPEAEAEQAEAQPKVA